MISDANLSGTRVLIVEDEPLISMFIEDCLTDIGCQTVAVATNLEEAVSRVAEMEFDVVMLDVNLGGKHTFELAEILCERKIPFIFSTGYGIAGIPPHLQHVPVLQKPFQENDLKAKLQHALASVGS